VGIRATGEGWGIARERTVGGVPAVQPRPFAVATGEHGSLRADVPSGRAAGDVRRSHSRGRQSIRARIVAGISLSGRAGELSWTAGPRNSGRAGGGERRRW